MNTPAITWYIEMHHVIGLKQTRGIKNVTLKAAKKIRECRGLLGRVMSRRKLSGDS